MGTIIALSLLAFWITLCLVFLGKEEIRFSGTTIVLLVLSVLEFLGMFVGLRLFASYEYHKMEVIVAMFNRKAIFREYNIGVQMVHKYSLNSYQVKVWKKTEEEIEVEPELEDEIHIPIRNPETKFTFYAD